MDRALHLMTSFALASLLAGCSSSAASLTVGVVAGALDSHCQGAMVMNADGGMPAPQYGATMFNSQGADDDCKYNLSFTVAPSGGGDDAFALTLTSRADGSPVAGASPVVEAFLSATHPAPNSGQNATESRPGTYQIVPLRFDAPGRWTVRFHLFEDCNDSETSPHGHAAFYLDVH